MDVLTALESLSEGVAKLASVVSAQRTKLVPGKKVRRLAEALAANYFGNIQAELVAVQRRAGLAEEIEWVASSILQLADGDREKSAYLGHVAEIRGYLTEARIDVMKAQGIRLLVLSVNERAILETLARMLPSTAASYEQVLQDIFVGRRISWRGTGTELREVLREVMDHLAPDAEVMAAPNFKLEADLKRPTQKQKVRFILKARNRAVGTASAALDTIDEGIPRLARSAYERGSASTHSDTDRDEIRRTKNYVDALLVELLEISQTPKTT